MGLWKEQYWIGKALYHAINCSRWNPEGRVLRMNPPLREIDRMFSHFRRLMKKMQRERFLKKDGSLYIVRAERSHESFFAMPFYGKKAYPFRLSDLTYAKWVMKNHRDLFMKMKDWNDLNWLVKHFRRLKLQKPKLTAQLIFAVWLFQADE